MGARISWRDVAGMEGLTELGFGEIFIGRSMECAIRTDDPLVSRRHARVFFQNGAHVIEDLQSANGIYLGEARVQAHTLQNGDSVRCGNLWLRYVNEQVSAFPGNLAGPAGPQMSPGGGTQLLQVNDPFIPGRQAESAGQQGMSPGLVAPMRPSHAGPQSGIGLPPNPFGQQMPPPISGGYVGPPSGGGIGGVIGSPPPPVGPPSGGPMPGPPPPLPGPPSGGQLGRSSPAEVSAVVDSAEVQRMQRRIDQLTSELRIIRGGGDRATRMEELEERASRLEKENEQIGQRYRELEKLVAQTGSDYNPNRASLQLSRAEEVVTGLNDVLSEVRINLLAADGELQQYAHLLPSASYELVREAIRSSRTQMETARDIMRMLRELR